MQMSTILAGANTDGFRGAPKSISSSCGSVSGYGNTAKDSASSFTTAESVPRCPSPNNSTTEGQTVSYITQQSSPIPNVFDTPSNVYYGIATSTQGSHYASTSPLYLHFRPLPRIPRNPSKSTNMQFFSTATNAFCTSSCKPTTSHDTSGNTSHSTKHGLESLYSVATAAKSSEVSPVLNSIRFENPLKYTGTHNRVSRFDPSKHKPYVTTLPSACSNQQPILKAKRLDTQSSPYLHANNAKESLNSRINNSKFATTNNHEKMSEIPAAATPAASSFSLSTADSIRELFLLPSNYIKNSSEIPDVAQYTRRFLTASENNQIKSLVDPPRKVSVPSKGSFDPREVLCIKEPNSHCLQSLAHPLTASHPPALCRITEQPVAKLVKPSPIHFSTQAGSSHYSDSKTSSCKVFYSPSPTIATPSDVPPGRSVSLERPRMSSFAPKYNDASTGMKTDVTHQTRSMAAKATSAHVTFSDLNSSNCTSQQPISTEVPQMASLKLHMPLYAPATVSSCVFVNKSALKHNAATGTSPSKQLSYSFEPMMQLSGKEWKDMLCQPNVDRNSQNPIHSLQFEEQKIQPTTSSTMMPQSVTEAHALASDVNFMKYTEGPSELTMATVSNSASATALSVNDLECHPIVAHTHFEVASAAEKNNFMDAPPKRQESNHLFIQKASEETLMSSFSPLALKKQQSSHSPLPTKPLSLRPVPPNAAVAARMRQIQRLRCAVTCYEHQFSYGWVNLDNNNPCKARFTNFQMDKIASSLQSYPNATGLTNSKQPVETAESCSKYISVFSKNVMLHSIFSNSGDVYISRATLEGVAKQEPSILLHRNNQPVLIHSRLVAQTYDRCQVRNAIRDISNILIKSERYLEKRRIQNSIRALLENLEASSEIPTLQAFFDKLNPSSGISQQEFINALQELNLWPPELTERDKEEVFTALCLSDYSQALKGLVLAEAKGPMLLTASGFINGMLFVPYNLPDFPVTNAISIVFESKSTGDKNTIGNGSEVQLCSPICYKSPTQTVEAITCCRAAISICEAMGANVGTLILDVTYEHVPLILPKRPFGLLWDTASIDWDAYKSATETRYWLRRQQNVNGPYHWDPPIPFWHYIQDFLMSRLVSLEELQVVLRELYSVECVRVALELIIGSSTAVLTPSEWNKLLSLENQRIPDWRHWEVLKRYDNWFTALPGTTPSSAMHHNIDQNFVEDESNTSTTPECAEQNDLEAARFSHVIAVLNSSATLDALKRLTVPTSVSSKDPGPFDAQALYVCCDLFLTIFKHSKHFKDVRQKFGVL